MMQGSRLSDAINEQGAASLSPFIIFLLVCNAPFFAGREPRSEEGSFSIAPDIE